MGLGQAEGREHVVGSFLSIAFTVVVFFLHSIGRSASEGCWVSPMQLYMDFQEPGPSKGIQNVPRTQSPCTQIESGSH